MRYFAYGRNMNPEVLKEKVADFSRVEKGKLKGFRLVFHRPGEDGSGKADLQDYRAGAVEGVVYEVSDAAMAELDRYQNVEGGLCRQQEVLVQTSKGELACIAYRANKFRAGLKPTKEYLQEMIAGAEKNSLSKDYLVFLRSHDTQ